MIETVSETGSTNADLLTRLGGGQTIAEGYWLRAEQQSSGRGRNGSKWISAPGNLYTSTVVNLRDDAFKSNVSRYIHDFEAMLRSMLSTRDGNALGVTILGSDMGKLYVVLAQAIERFRQ